MVAKIDEIIDDRGKLMDRILLPDGETKAVRCTKTKEILTENGKSTAKSGRELGIDELNGENSPREKMNGGELSPESLFGNRFLSESHGTPHLGNGYDSPENEWDSVSLSEDRLEKESVETNEEITELSFGRENGHVSMDGILLDEKSPENGGVTTDGLPYREKSSENEITRAKETVIVPHTNLPLPEKPQSSVEPEEIHRYLRSQSEPSESIARFFRDSSSAILKRFSSSQSNSGDVVDGFNQFYLTGMKVTVHLKRENHDLRGRVTFFSRSGCRDCTAVRTFFREKLLRFSEINLDVYPEREPELVLLTGNIAVPAIFFNEKFVGGLVALNSLRNSGQFDHRLDEMTAGRCPANAPEAPVYGFDGAEEEELDQLADIARVFRHRLPIQDRLVRMKIVRNCFSGGEVVEELIHHLDCSRKKAVEVGRRLARKHFFHHVFQENEFEDGNHFYRFLEHEQFVPRCFNFRGSTNDDEPKPAAQVGKKLATLMIAILESYASDDRRHVDYARIGTSEEFRRYVNLIQDLQRVDLSVLSVDQRLRFFLNMYNAMVLHALIRMGRPEGVIDRLALFNEFQYIIGGHPYSLSAIRNGILRCNRRQPYLFAKPFGASDKRLQFALTKLNPLIHFVLCDGTKSKPVVRFFTSDRIEAALTSAAMEFLCEDGLQVNLDSRTIYLTKIIKWYSADFGEGEDLFPWIVNYLDSTKAKMLIRLLNDGSAFDIAYKNYDWSLNI